MRFTNGLEKGAQCAPQNSSFDIGGAQEGCNSEEEDFLRCKTWLVLILKLCLCLKSTRAMNSLVICTRMGNTGFFRLGKEGERERK